MRSGALRRISTLPLDWAMRPFGIFLDPDLRRRGRWILYAAAIGVVSGLGAILFDLMFRFAQANLIGRIGRFIPPGSGMEGGPGHPPEAAWLLPVSLVIGGLISGALVFGLAPEAEGHGTDAVIKSFHHLRGRIRRRIPFIKAVSSAITIGSGGSAGREGPIAQIGAGFGSYLADLVRLRNNDRRIMMMAGVAGGVGSIFRAPLGAAFFAAECLYTEPEFEYKVLLPSLIAAIAGYSIYSTYAGWGFLFDVPRMNFHEPSHLPLYIVLGILCAIVGGLYPKIFYGIRDRIFHPMPIPRWTKPAVGGLVLGLIAMVFPEALGMGYGYIQQAIDGQRTIQFLILFMIVKIVATSLTISSGGSGGVFGPSLVIGGALGGAFGLAVQAWFPAVAPPPAAFIMVGMGGFFAGVAKVPFASVIMVMEMTGSYGLLVPSLLVATIAYLFLPPGLKLYENQLTSRAESPAHLGSFAIDILRLGRIKDTWEPAKNPGQPIAASMTLTDLMEMAQDSPQNLFPIVNREGVLIGELSIDDIRRALLSDTGNLIVAMDLMRPVVGPLTLNDDLARAAKLLADRETDAVTVVKDLDHPEVLGTFSRRDLIVAYGRQLEQMKKLD